MSFLFNRKKKTSSSSSFSSSSSTTNSTTPQPPIVSNATTTKTVEQLQQEEENKFLDAAKYGNLDKIKEYINNGGNKEAKDNYGWTALHWASRNGHLNIIKYLIETCHVDKEAKTNDGWNALHYASYNGYLDIVKYLIESCQVDTEVKNYYGQTACDLAKKSNNNNVVKYLEKARVHSTTTHVNNAESGNASAATNYDFALVTDQKKSSTTSTNTNSTTPQIPIVSNTTNTKTYEQLQQEEKEFLDAAENGNLNIVKGYINNGGNKKTESNNGRTALHCASYNGHLDIVKYLIETCQVNKEAKTNSGETALHIAIEFGRLEIVQYLIETYQVDTEAKNNNGWTALHFASRYGHLYVVKYLIETCQVDTEAKNNNGWTALHFASRYGHLNIIQYLIESCQVDTEAKTNDGQTVYDLARKNNKSNVVQYLETVGADSKTAKVYNKKVGKTTTATNDNTVVVAGQSSTTTNTTQNTDTTTEQPLTVSNTTNTKTAEQLQREEEEFLNAAKYGNLDKIKEYINNGGNKEANDNNGWTALHWASFKGHLSIVQYLIETLDFDKEAKNNNGCTALHCAIVNGHLKIVQFLIESCHVNTDAKTSSGETAYVLAIACNSTDVAQYLKKQLSSLLPSSSSSSSTTNSNSDSTQQPPSNTTNTASLQSETTQDIVNERERQKMKGAVVDGTITTTFAVSENYIHSILTKKELGRGFFGVVYKGIDSELNCCVAVKVINTEILAGGHAEDVRQAKKSFETEQQTLSHFRHPNIVALYAYSFPEDLRGNYYLVYEIAENGSLDYFWKNELTRLRLTFRRRVQIALDILTALRFLHVGNKEKGITSCFHRDIKSSNIVLKNDLTAQLIDCGLAKFVVEPDFTDETYSRSSGIRKGTAGYICPEYSEGEIPYDCACDVYSFGILLIELWTGRLQNYQQNDGTKFNFQRQYVGGINLPRRDVKMDADPSFGYYPNDIPPYMTSFVELALKCLQEHRDIPSTDYVMSQLATIRLNCVEHEDYKNEASGYVCSTSAGSMFEYARSSHHPGHVVCERCQSFPRVPAYGNICQLCHTADEYRKNFQMILDLLGVTNYKLDVMSPILGDLDARHTNVIPRHFIIVPASRKNALLHPRECYHSLIATKYYLYFVCTHKKCFVEGARIKMKLNKQWVEKAAPVLAVCLRVIQLSLNGVGVPLKLEGDIFDLSAGVISNMLAAIMSLLKADASHAALVNRLDARNVLRLDDVPELTGDAYEAIREKAMEQREWRAYMEPVRTKHNPKTLWVSKDIADDTTNGYIRIK